MDGDGLDAIVITASGCGTTIKDYGFMFRDDPAYAEKARAGLGARQGRHRVPGRRSSSCRRCAMTDLVVAYHSACSMQHGQQIQDGPEGAPEEGRLHGQGRARRPYLLRLGRHLQHPAAGDRRAAARAQGREHRADQPDLIATGNIGCMTQIGKGTSIPIVHTVELLDWATGGPLPEALEGLSASVPASRGRTSQPPE